MKFIGSNSRTDHVDVDKGSKTPSSAKNEPADIPASFHCITEGYHLPDQNRVYDWLVASSTGYAAEDRCGLGDRSSLRRILRNSREDGKQRKAGANINLIVKVRLQTRGPGAPTTMLGTFGHVIKSDGILGLYRGLSAALLRQMTYSTTRFGIYEELKSRFTSPDAPASTLTLVGMACTSGFLGGIAGNPADVMNVRMQSDAALPVEQRRNYRHAFHGLVQMTRHEGPASLFRGVWPNSTRAVLMTASQLASYDTFKRLCIDRFGMSDNLGTHFTASFLAGFVATTVCSPVDVIKTRVMTASPAESRGHSIVGLLRDITRKEGFAWAFRGWVPSFIRLGPHTIATFIFLEEHKKLYRLLKGVSEEKHTA